MPYGLDHWRNPRATIATRLRSNDLAYATHGAIQVGVMLRKLGHLPAMESTLLDYGCGTGRIGRCATSIFMGGVYGYDPVAECIAHGKKEASPLVTVNLMLTANWSNVPEVDYGLCVSVMEHLTPEAQAVMLGHLRQKVRGPSVIWYRPATNGAALMPWMSSDERREDEVNPEAIRVRAFTLRA